MEKNQISEWYEKYGSSPIRLSPYSLARTGLISRQTILKINEYMLFGSPYELSLRNASLLVILSRDEIRFFREFKHGRCGLSMTFQVSGADNTMNVEIKTVVDRMAAVKNRKNLCLIDLTFSERPPELIPILADFHKEYGSLKMRCEKLADRIIQIETETARKLRFNGVMECFLPSGRTNAELCSVSSNRLTFTVSASGIRAGSPFSAKLYFQPYRFMVSGSIDRIGDHRSGGKKVQGSISFCPELVRILDDYFHGGDESSDGKTPGPVL